MLLALGILVVLFDSVRKKISNKAKSMYAKAELSVKKNILALTTLLEKLLAYVKKSAPYIEVSAIVIDDLYRNIALLKKEIGNMKAEDIAHFS